MPLIVSANIFSAKQSKSNTPCALDLCIVFLACLGLFFIALGSNGLIDPGDGYYTEGAREMVESGNYVVPHLNYQIYFSKPILMFWLVCAAYKLFGINEFAARFWPALSATIAALVVYELTRSLTNRRCALIASLIFAVSPLVMTFARMAMIDMVLSCLLAVALWAFVNTVFFERPYWWGLVYIMLALGCLLKGPVAPFLFVLGAGAFLLVKRPAADKLAKWFHLLHPFQGAVLLLLIVAPWCIAVSIATGGLFLKVFLWFENIGRFCGQVNHKRPELWFYLPVIAYGFFPWVLCLPAAIKDALQGRLTADYGVVEKDSPGRYNSADASRLRSKRDAVFFLACWALSVIVFFSLSTAKLETYVLPCWFVFAVLVGTWLDRATADHQSENNRSADVGNQSKAINAQVIHKAPRSFRYLSVLCFACAMVVAAIAGIVCGMPMPVLQATLQTTLQTTLQISVIYKILIVAGSLVLAAGWLYQWFLYRRGRLTECLGYMVLPAVLAASIVAPAVSQIVYRLKEADLDAVVIRGRSLKLAIFQEFKPSLMFYAREPIDSFFHPGQLVPVSESGDKCCTDQKTQHSSAEYEAPQYQKPQPQKPQYRKLQYVIASDKALPLLTTRHGDSFKAVYKQGVWGLYLTQGLTLIRLPTLEQTFRQNLNLSVGNYTWGTLPFAAGKD